MDTDDKTKDATMKKKIDKIRKQYGRKEQQNAEMYRPRPKKYMGYMGYYHGNYEQTSKMDETLMHRQSRTRLP